MQIYKFEIRRAFRTPGFYLALLIGSGVAVADWVDYGLKYFLNQEEWMKVERALVYPVSSYVSWIGNSDSKYAMLFFFLVPLLATMAFADSFYRDNRTNYITSIFMHVDRKSYFWAKFWATFVSGGSVTTAPLALNFVLNAASLPSIYPQVASGQNLILPKSSFAELYYGHPFWFVIVSLGIVFVFSGTLAVSALYITFFSKRIYTVMVFPFALCLVIMAVTDLTVSYSWQHINFLNPVYSSPRVMPFVVETVVLFSVAVWQFVQQGQKLDVR